MFRYLPIFLSLVIVITSGYWIYVTKSKLSASIEKFTTVDIGTFKKQTSCVQTPQFLEDLKISQPVMIDLSQKRFKGIALLHGKQMEKSLHPKVWEKYEHFSTYVLDKEGNIYLVPTPFISVKPTTFNLQKNIYLLDTKTGNLEIFMHFDDVHPSAYNPYGLSAIAYDCDDHTLWVAAIDESSYEKQRGVIYHIDIKTKQILFKREVKDALTIALLQTSKGKYLLLGAARDNALYSYQIIKKENVSQLSTQPQKILELSNANEHIRKIKIKGTNKLEIQSIPFSYTLIAQADKKDRIYYDAKWENVRKVWHVTKH